MNHTVKKVKNKRISIFIMIAAVITAIAVAVTCAVCIDKFDPVSVDGVGSGEVSTSTAYTNPASGTSYATSLKANDTITYTSVGNFQVTLPKGTYTFDVYGAAGATNTSNSVAGGLGGRAMGSYSITATSKTFWVYVGGQGASNAGGANGGGGGRWGGGGASHIATSSGVLNSVKSSTLIAAGGGGGAGANKGGAGGAGGGANGANGAASQWATSGGGGATTSAAGAAGSAYSNENVGVAGSGANGGTSGSANTRGGGGGGGWFGGGSGGNDIAGSDGATNCGASGGGGGSGYVGGVTSPTTSQGVQSGNGKIMITAKTVNINNAPTSKNATINSNRARGSSGTTTINVTSVAQDNDSGQSVYFSAGSSANYETLAAANQGLFINTSNTLATKYLDWSWTSTELKITAFKMYPRNGVDGCTSNGRLTLYTWVRDSYGTTTTHAVTRVMFYLNFGTNTVSTKSGSISTTINGATKSYIVGTGTTTTAPALDYTPTTSNIYNPNGARYTAIMPEPLRKNTSFVVKASDLLSGVVSYDQVLIGLNSTTNIASSNANRVYKINEFDANSKTAGYNVNGSALANTFSQLTFTCLNPSHSFQVFTVTLYIVEKTTAKGNSGANANWQTNVSNVTMDIVFATENSRPTIGSASNIVEVAVGETRALSLSSYFADVDSAISSTTHTITNVVVPTKEFVQLDAHAKIVAPTGNNAGFYNVGAASSYTKSSTEFTSTATTGENTGFNSAIAYNSTNTAANGSNTTRQAFMRFTYANDVLTVVGLRSSFSQYSSARASKPGHFYLLLHIQDKRNTADNGIWLPLAFRIGYSVSYAPVAAVTAPNTGTTATNVTEQSAVANKPTAAGAPNQSFYFAPMAINYNGSHVVGKYMKSDGTLTSDGLQPLAIDGDNFATDNGLAARNGKLNDFLRLKSTTAESIVRSVSDVGVSTVPDIPGAYQNKFIIAEIINIYVPTSYFATGPFQGASGGRVIVGNGTPDANGYKYVTFDTNKNITVGGVDYYAIDGIKITLKAATMNRYFYANAAVSDVTDKSVTTIDIAIRVNNVAPIADANADNVALFGDSEETDAYNSYDNVTMPTIRYKLPLGGKIAVTPYDFVTDSNIDNMGAVRPAGGFTLNGIIGAYDPSSGTLIANPGSQTGSNVAFNGLYSSSYGTSTYLNSVATMLGVANGTTAVKKISSAAAGVAASSGTLANQNVPNDKLFFARTGSSSDAYTYNPTTFSDFAVTANGTIGHADYTFGSKVRINSVDYGVDFILITATSRTSQPAYIDLVVRDRYGDSPDCVATIAVRIVVEVVNTTPSVKDEFRYQELAASPIDIDGKVTLSAVTFTSNGNGEATGLITDLDGDIPEFILSSGYIITNTKNIASILGRKPSSFDEVINNHPELLTDNGKADGKPLSEYISVTLVSRYELFVQALSSTKSIKGGVYVCFLVNDGNGGSSVGYVQIEVVDSAPVFNTSLENGFDKNDPVWSVLTTSNADITRNRYIVGSTAAAELLKEHNGAVDSDIKLIASDADALHGKLLLSQRADNAEDFDYVNLEIPEDKTSVIADTAFQTAVPNVNIATNYGLGGAAVAVFTRTIKDDGKVVDTPTVPNRFTAEILFFVDGEWITRDKLIEDHLSGNNIDGVSDFFDAQGRFVFADWAFHIHATEGFENNVRVGIKVSVRDQVLYGGDTAGIASAFASDRRNGAININVAQSYVVYHTISTTGIRTKDEFTASYNDYYTVEFTDDKQHTTAYVPTYDGNKTTVYDDKSNVTDITYASDGGKNRLVLDGNGSKSIKERQVGQPDQTLAGIYAGTEYGDQIAQKGLAGAYKYPSIIEVPANKTSKVYVPMSYFGLLQSLVGGADSDGTFDYLNEYVGYNVGAQGVAYNRSVIDDIAQAISLTDGNTVWTGETLNDNPYINIDAFDMYAANGSTDSSAIFAEAVNKPYYNNRLSVLTVSDEDELTGYEQNEANRKNFIGNGRLMYLEEQAKKLQEHNFGLVFNKTDMRTGVTALTLTIKLAKSEAGKVAVEDENDYRTVSVSVHIANSKMDISADGESGDKTGTKYDSEKGIYYMDVTMPTSSSQSFALSRRDEKGNVETISSAYADAKKVAYSDEDYGDSAKTRDRAYFYADSFNKLSAWSAGADAYERVLALNDGMDAFKNTSSSSGAQNSVLAYLGITDFADAEDFDTDFKPNDGIYGSNTGIGSLPVNPDGIEGYSSYFNVSMTEMGRVLNITASRKTKINEVALKGVTTQAEAKEFYAKRGLVAEYKTASDDPMNPSRVYYPFRVLVYDSCGAGWMDASYVAFEFRIEITNSDPSLKAVGDPVYNQNDKLVGREYSLNLAVGNSVTINLYDIVTDPDMYILSTGNNYALATEEQFLNTKDIVLETGDYLDSPFAHDKYLTGELTYNKYNTVEKEDGTYYRNGGGLSLMGSTEYDVIMWMETDRDATSVDKTTAPLTNNLSFTVNRRSTATVDGKSVSINEYRFTLWFYDGFACETLPITFIINITNQAPVITAEERHFTMFSGDDLTLLTAYYDEFIGGAEFMDSEEGGSDAYVNSGTKQFFDSRTSMPGYGEDNGDGQNSDTGNKYWTYGNITSDLKEKVVYNSTEKREGSGSMHLGYLGLASDDTPWKLRISSVSYYTGLGVKLWVEQNTFRLKTESEYSSEPLPMSVTVHALAACENEPLTLTLIDGEDGMVTVTLYITIISSAPTTLDYSDPNDKALIEASGLEGETDGTEGVYLPGTYRMFTVPDGEIESEIDGFSQKKKAKHEFSIAMTSVAKDADSDYETANMRLFGDGNFSVNGVPLIRNADNVYESDYFDIRVTDNGRSFLLTATGYNPDTTVGYEILTFRVADTGNGSYENSIEVTLHVYTSYSDMTNPTVAAMTADQMTAYLRGGEKVHVKSYDEYYGVQKSSKSRFAFLDLEGNKGNDGNTASPIVDRDVDKINQQSYTSRLYAFMDMGEDGKWHALSDTAIGEMLERDVDSKSFALKSSAASAANAYLIGGIMHDGNVIPVNSAAIDKLNAVNQYAQFEFTDGGSALLFAPMASTLDNNEVILYVEAQKYVSSNRSNSRTDAHIASGALFRLEVEDSAPVAVSDSGMQEGVNWTASGSKGDTVTFKIHDENNPYGALFTDSDLGDTVTIANFADEDYDKALEGALKEDPKLDWNASGSKPRAFSIDVDSAKNELKITVNRRMDSFVSGKYAQSVTFPIEFVGYDKVGKTAKTVIMLTISNRGVSALENVESKYDAETDVGYSFETAEDGSYVINAQIKYSHGLVIDLADFMYDPDYISADVDGDSYMFAGSSKDVHPYKYLQNESQDVYYYETDENGQINEDKFRLLAKVEPVGDDEWHRTAIKITAADTTRTLKAKTYVRVLDRAADITDVDVGVYITLNIEVMNDSPFVKEGQEVTEITMIGAENKTPTGSLFFIGDFVSDNNESDVTGDVASAASQTYLRIFSQQPSAVKSLYSPSKTAASDRLDGGGEVLSSSLFNVTIPQTIPEDLLRAREAQRAEAGLPAENKDSSNLYNQWFIITPIQGYYGEGSIEITIADGDSVTQPDSLSTTFRINVSVVYDQATLGSAFEPISIKQCKTRSIDIGALMPDLENKLVLEDNGGVQTSASGSTFSQSEYYTLSGIEIQNTADKDYVEIMRVGNSGVWTLTAKNLVTLEPIRVNVRYVLNADPTTEYSRFFMLSVTLNEPPVIKYDSLTFVRYDRTNDLLRDLDDSNTIRLEAWQLFSDADDPEGTAIRFVKVKSKVPAIVSATLSDDKRFLIINFAAKGQSEITVHITDETGDTVPWKFIAVNNDLPEGSIWLRMAASFQANMLIWILVIAAIILLLILLIVLITVLRKRKIAREELEALLVSEMEFEDQMLKLAGGDTSAPGYQSYGYLPPSGVQMPEQDPSTLLGAGESAAQPQADVPELAAPPTDMPPTDGGDVPPDDNDGGNIVL